MRKALGAILLLLATATPAAADQYQDTLRMFRDGGAGLYLDTAYGYAIFPTIGKGGFGIGGAYGEGRVYQQGQHVGNTEMAQLTLGWQFGGQAYSQMIFFKDQRAFEEFTNGNFEFGAQATAVALTAGVSAETSTKGVAAGASGGKNNAKTVGQYYKGMSVFTIAKGGLMYEATIGGQKFNYKSLLK